MTRIAVILLTCNRPAYTARTVESFTRYNRDRSRFVLLHGDDASETNENIALAASHGFRTVLRWPERRGTLALRTKMLVKAAAVAPWVLVLENDIESVRPFPWLLFDTIESNERIYSLRLYGRFKDAERLQPCKTSHQWKNDAPVTWSRLKHMPEPAEVADIHWSAQPAVTRSVDAVALHRRNARELERLTARVVTNVMVHIGTERTAPPAFTRTAVDLTC